MAPSRKKDGPGPALPRGMVRNSITGRPMPDRKSIDYLANFRKHYYPEQDPNEPFIDHDAYSPSLRPGAQRYGQEHLQGLTRQHLSVPDLGSPDSTRQPKFVLSEAAARIRVRNALAAQNALQDPTPEELPTPNISAEKEAVEVVEDVREKTPEVSPSVLKRRRSTRNKTKVQTPPVQDVEEPRSEVIDVPEEVDDVPEEVVVSKPRLGPSALKRKHRPSERAKAG